MSKWCYIPCKIIHEDDTETWDIRTYYINEDEKVVGWSSSAIYAFGETIEELKSDLDRMVNDVNKHSPLILYAYTCTSCGEKDARTEKDRNMCDECLGKSSTD
jgi:hypothetical protein